MNEGEKMNLHNQLTSLTPILAAIGNETRLQIIATLLEMHCCAPDNGVQVGEITANISLSRPAVSHHLKILKDARMINVYRQGTKNYYYLDPDQAVLEEIKKLINNIQRATK